MDRLEEILISYRNKGTDRIDVSAVLALIKSLKEKEMCECGGNERVALDCTMRPCKHPKYIKFDKSMWHNEAPNPNK